MRKIFRVFLFFSLIFIAVSCIEEDESLSSNNVSNSDYTPILMHKSELANSVVYKTAQELKRPGKIYLKGNYIYINEKYKGVHIIDNTNPSNPQKTGFIKIPGCIDIAIKHNTLYADNAVDLVAVDISDLPTIKVTKRIEDVFPEHTPPNNNWIPFEFQPENRPENTVIIEWIKNPVN